MNKFEPKGRIGKLLIPMDLANDDFESEFSQSFPLEVTFKYEAGSLPCLTRSDDFSPVTILRICAAFKDSHDAVAPSYANLPLEAFAHGMTEYFVEYIQDNYKEEDASC